MNLTLTISVLVGVVVIGILIAILAAFLGAKEEIKPNYRMLFTMGIIWVGSGIAIGASTGNHALWLMGLLWMGIGLANREKWDQEPKWSELSQEARRFKVVSVAGLTLLLVAGTGLFLAIRLSG
jgi:hypothetical protein